MKKDTDQTEGSNSCSCEGDSCGGGSCKCKWIWLAFLLALVGVLVAKNLNSKPEPAPSSIVEIDTVAAPASRQEPLPRLVDLGASSCIPCKAMKPILDDLMVNYGGAFKTEFIDVWENPDAGQKHGIRAIPTQIFYDAAGNELYRHEGFFGKDDILAKWREFGVGMAN